MASLLCRSTAHVARRTLFLAGARASSHGSGNPPVDPHRGKVASDKVSMPDELGHAVGLQRLEMLAGLKGKEDPFEMHVKEIDEETGTKEKPTLVPSMYDTRLVGCICEDDSVTINWLYLHKGECRRCQCGYYFQLTQTNPADFGSEVDITKAQSN